MAELDRCVAFLRELDRRGSNRQLPSRFGVAFVHDGLPRVWSRNFLLAEQGLEDASADGLAAETDRLLGGVGVRHRKVEIHDGDVGERLEPGFHAIGWTAECDVVMVHRRHIEAKPNAPVAEEVVLADLAPIWAQAIRDNPVVTDDETVRQLIANKAVVESAIDTRFFAARVEDDIASYCDLYSDGHTGQIEAVMTLEPYRNRGLARAVVSRALGASRESGNDLTFLLAMRDDWPKELYRKLGFEQIGRIYDFVRPA